MQFGFGRRNGKILAPRKPRFLKLQPALECGFDVINDASVKFARCFADEFDKLNWLDALDINVTLLLQPRHPRQFDLVGCVSNCVVIKTTLAYANRASVLAANTNA